MAEAILSDDELDLTVEGDRTIIAGGEETESRSAYRRRWPRKPATGRRDAGDDDDAGLV